MGKLAEVAGVDVKGPQTVTYPDGSRTYASPEAAETAIGGRTVEHKRGGFFVEQGSAFDGDARSDAPKPVSKKK
jgi:hypothetical protein